MLMTILNIAFVLVAIAMVALILMQRGAGAQAGSGFGGGASATVFGSRGSSNFLTKSTKWLAIAFFVITLVMAWEASRGARPMTGGQDMGVMGSVPAAQNNNNAAKIPAAQPAVPTAPAQAAPQQATQPQTTPSAQPTPQKEQ